MKEKINNENAIGYAKTIQELSIENRLLMDKIQKLEYQLGDVREYLAEQIAYARRDLIMRMDLGFVAVGVMSEDELNGRLETSVTDALNDVGFLDLRVNNQSNAEAILNYMKGQPIISSLNGVVIRTATARDIRMHFGDDARATTHRRLADVCKIYGEEMFKIVKSQKGETTLVYTSK